MALSQAVVSRGLSARADAAEPLAVELNGRRAISRNFDMTTPGAELVGRQVLAVDRDTGVVRLAFLARPEFANRHGTVAGGFLAAMLDSTTAAPILESLSDDQTIVTTELHVYYLKPARLGELFGAGWISTRDEREVHAEAELSDPDGVVVARAEATFRLVRR